MKRLLLLFTLLLALTPLASAGTIFSFYQAGPGDWPTSGTIYANYDRNGWQGSYAQTPYSIGARVQEGTYGGFRAGVQLTRPITTSLVPSYDPSYNYQTYDYGNWQLSSASVYNQGSYGLTTTRLSNGQYTAGGFFGTPSTFGSALRPAPTYSYQRTYPSTWAYNGGYTYTAGVAY